MTRAENMAIAKDYIRNRMAEAPSWSRFDNIQFFIEKIEDNIIGQVNYFEEPEVYELNIYMENTWHQLQMR